MLVNKINRLIACLLLSACFFMPKAAAAGQGQNSMTAVKEMRQSYRDMIPLAGVGDQVASVRDENIPAESPARSIPLRIYTPVQEKPQANLPVFLFIHGGGFISGDLDTHDVLLRGICSGADCVVVSVGYRLAPEHPFPAGLEDVYAALLWTRDHAAALGGDKTRIVVGGDSAGGNLAASLALLARDRKGPKLAGQWLMYPTVSNRMDTESWKKLGDEHFPTRELNSIMIAAYVAEGTSLDDPLAAPLWADLKNLPPALVQVGGFDPLSDECRQYAQKLEANGNEASFLFYPEHPHGFLQFYKDGQNFPGAQPAFEQGLNWLREIFARTAPAGQ
jgi:acetyl esterase